jgi:CelD/BcsL family acetyltransferase involved in cellulose biosynthesis
MCVSLATVDSELPAGLPLSRETVPLDFQAPVPQWWQALHAAMPGASIFVSPLWMQTWLARYGHAFSGEWVRWHSQGKTVGGVLVLRRTRWRKGVPLRCLYLNTSEDVTARSPQAEFNQVLHDPAYAQPVATALANYLHTHRWDCIALSGFEQTPFSENLLAKLRYVQAESEAKPAPFVDLTALPTGTYAQTLGGRSGAQIRQSIRQYEEKFGPLRLEEAQDDASRQHYLNELARLHNTLWRDRGVPGAFDCAEFMTFHNTLVARGGPQGAIKLLRVQAGQHVLGYLYALNDHGCVYVYQSGFCYENDTKLRPGLVTHALAISYCRDQGLHEYNLMAGDSQYKRTLAKQRRDVCWTTLYANTLASRLFVALRDFKRYVKPVAAPEDPAAA